ncbi:uncharacterized protein Dwil_GK12967 [Drosophila willistoni]|uniref:hypoxia-inducible factor-proline dioxygenase n=1 Tax=Drosophila willistoni TaxID=7260 RepID=B4NI63_DROWI|nr:egl nine homolog 1 isoform X1 [Drosophila willistoni]EDW84755.1 uncharacterized protein Dwil_GK12967 [Drosophila willistoni]
MKMSRGKRGRNTMDCHQLDTPRCSICGTTVGLLRCAKCKAIYYCSTACQHIDWPSHRQECRLLARQKSNQTNNNNNNNISSNNNNNNHSNNHKMQQLQQAVAATTLIENGAGAAANCSTAQMMTPAHQAQSWPADVATGMAGLNGQRHQHQHGEKSSSYQIGLTDSSFMGSGSERRYEDLCRNIINDMNQYGLSVVDDFLGPETGLKILNEVRSMYNAGAFQDGQLQTDQTNPTAPTVPTVRGDKAVRGDKIKWVVGNETGCSNVRYLTNQIDSVVFRVNTMKDNGILGKYDIRERTRAMVACYPGSGTHYVMHVDNPSKDGRVITAIYYLNINWDARESGGILRIRPTPGTTVADIEPKFDRLIFFWSDGRNPHEVQPAHRTRYAITVWYFDAKEREEALNRALEKNKTNNAINNGTTQQDQDQHTEPDSTTKSSIPPTPASSSPASSTSSSSSSAAAAATLATLPATMSTGNANVASNSSCSAAASSEICT